MKPPPDCGNRAQSRCGNSDTRALAKCDQSAPWAEKLSTKPSRVRIADDPKAALASHLARSAHPGSTDRARRNVRGVLDVVAAPGQVGAVLLSRDGRVPLLIKHGGLRGFGEPC